MPSNVMALHPEQTFLPIIQATFLNLFYFTRKCLYSWKDYIAMLKKYVQGACGEILWPEQGYPEINTIVTCNMGNPAMIAG